MSATHAMLLEPDRPGTGQAALWLAAAGIAMAAHIAAAIYPTGQRDRFAYMVKPQLATVMCF